MRKSLRWAFAFGLLFAALFAGGIRIYWRWGAAPANPRSTQVVRVVVAQGSTAKMIGRTLAQDGIIRSRHIFAYLGRGAKIREGTYDFTAAESPAQILRHLEHGDFATIRVTFPEGFIIRQIAHRLFRETIIPDENRFLNLVTSRGTTLHASFPLPSNLEGYLFPDTYRFPVGSSDVEIAQTMVNTFDRRVAKPKADDVRRTGRSLADIVNIASMIEKEAEIDADRGPIAGVIYNRLAKPMHLELDATVQYAQGFHKTRMLFKDLTIDSPYNTYKYAGLPPTPICNPGLPSIEAALHPAKSDFLYYVARPDGSHMFARTFAEHEHNIAFSHAMARAAGGHTKLLRLEPAKP